MNTLTRLEDYKVQKPTNLFKDATLYCVPGTDTLTVRCALLEEFLDCFVARNQATAVSTSNHFLHLIELKPKIYYSLNVTTEAGCFILLVNLNGDEEEWDSLNYHYDLTPLLLLG